MSSTPTLSRASLPAAVLLLASLAGCRNDEILQPPGPAKDPVYVAAAIKCVVTSSGEADIRCSESGIAVGSSAAGAIQSVDSAARQSAARGRFEMSSVVLLGGQNSLVRILTSATSIRNMGSVNRISSWLKVRNLLTQPLGTADGVTPDSSGIVILLPLASGPNPLVVSGSGAVNVVNADTTGFWTAAGEKGFKYAALVPGSGETAARKWEFDVSTGVTSFELTLYVAARLPDESPTTLSSPLPPRTFSHLATNPASYRTCGIRSTTNYLYCWGDNSDGASGTTTDIGRTTPSSPVSDLSFSSLSLGFAHACGITASGIAQCWGENLDGQVSGTGSYHPVARHVIGNMAWTMIDPGNSFTCGITGSGAASKLWCWGYNRDSQLGDGTTDSRVAPTLIAVPEPITTVSGGDRFACGISVSGAAYCWGNNANGQLGDGTTTNRSTPVAVTMPPGISFQAISVGWSHVCALSTAGSSSPNSLFCWGRNTTGELGDGTFTQRTVPTAVSAAPGFSRVTVGARYTCALAGSNLYCWGDNSFGQLGNGSIGGTITTPSAVAGTWVDVSAGEITTCGVSTGAGAYCWGDSWYGTLGNGSRRTATGTPTAVSGGASFVAVRVGALSACGLDSAGMARCWGDDRKGQIGDGSLTLPLTPQRVIANLDFTQAAVGLYFTCGLATGGQAYCWGDNSSGALGGGTAVEYSLTPVAVTTTSGARNFASIAGGQAHACGLTTAGAAWCWGSGVIGERGDSTTAFSYVATEVKGGHVFSRIVAGASHSCGLDTSGMAWCWGSNTAGQLGKGDLTNATAPAPVTMPSGVTFSKLAAGRRHTCALTAGGAAYCWGQNTTGQLGDGSTINRTTPTLVSGGTAFTAIAPGNFTTCALATDGTARCWGGNDNGELGNGTYVSSTSPVAVLMPAGVTFNAITAGNAYTCAISTGGVGYCWGLNFQASFGNGTGFRSNQPTPILLQ
jgi:alpha-tubulin suppressor-like RCC1 family protein